MRHAQAWLRMVDAPASLMPCLILIPTQVYWGDAARALPLQMSILESKGTMPLQSLNAARLPPLRQPIFGSWRVPLAVHFAGCQLCSGKVSARAELALSFTPIQNPQPLH